VSEKAREAYGWDLIEDAKKVIGFIFSGDRDSFQRQTLFDRGRFPRRRSRIDELREYVLPRWDHLFGWRELKRRSPHVVLPRKLRGTGPEERSIGTVVGHRPPVRTSGERTFRA
jgi:hypothetical protein